MKTDLVERLRRQYREQGTNYVQEAADVIEQLVAENARLQKACASGWGEPALINQLTAERDALRAEVEGWMKDNSAGGWIYELRESQSQNRIDAERYRWLTKQTRLRVESDGSRWTDAEGRTFICSHSLSAGDTKYGAYGSLNDVVDAAMGAKP
jgi:hypothetical protein